MWSAASWHAVIAGPHFFRCDTCEIETAATAHEGKFNDFEKGMLTCGEEIAKKVHES